MVQPFNYSIGVDPSKSFTQGLQLGAGIAEQDQLRAQREAKLLDQKRKAEAFAKLGPGATYDDYANALAAYGDQAQELSQFWKATTEAKRNAIFGAAQNAWMRLRPGPDGKVDPTTAVAELETAALAFENSNDKETARQLRDAASFVKSDPENGAKTIGIVLTGADPERAKAMMGSAENTAFQRDYDFIKEQAGEDAANQFVTNRYDPIVSIPLPGGRVYMGPRSGAPGTATGAAPSGPLTKTVNGQTFYSRDGVDWYDNPEYR